MRVAISFPPFESEKGIPLLSQNRQYQVFSTRSSSGHGIVGLLNKFVGNNATVIFPVLPAYAATLLQQVGHEAIWLDGIAEGWTWEEYCRQVELARPELMMIETKTPCALAMYECIADLKSRFPDMKIALVGDHITALPEEPFLYCPVDYTIRGGQFDFAIVNLANFLSGHEGLGSGVFWREGTDIRNSGVEPKPPQFLEVRPHIDRELVKWRSYAYRNGNFLKVGTYGWATGAAGGDCWWRRRIPGGPAHGGGCTFCSWTSLLPEFSVRPVEDYLDELEYLVSIGVQEVFDDTGTFPAGRWLHKFCEGFRARGLHKVLMMGCNMRADALDEAEYEMLASCNFRFILYGIESASQRTLDLLNKGTTVQQQWDSVHWASSAGLEPHATCMVGYPWETFEEAKRTVEYTRECFDRGWINTLQGTIVMPYPGTQLYAQARANDWLRFDGPENWRRYDMREPVLISPIPDEEILGLVQSLYTSFLTPRYVARKLGSALRSRDHFRYYVVRGSRYVVGHLLDFRKEQVTSRPFSEVGAPSGVAELPVKLYTVGGETAPVPVELLLERRQAGGLVAAGTT
ncbi:MAG TPA: radical SAM protein [Thermoleophilia bacterium]|nr:radical SAM protein [Thermoleophilia bacterium]